MFPVDFCEIFKTRFYRVPPDDCFCSREKHFTKKTLEKKGELEITGKKNNKKRRK